ncbi:MAG: cation:proton antiporter, partial [Phycisphaerales bacterium]|nr:cation:proton antiporter [Phycisphaerales bacterium]
MEPLFGLALVVILGVGAQWLAWRVRVPSILLLLAFGFAVGPIWTLLSPSKAPLLDPDKLLGVDLLQAVVAISVALILYEGGLTLQLSEISRSKRVVRNLVLIGALVTWVLSALFAWMIFGVEEKIAVLFGAVLVVTGPTVIGPLLNHVRPVGDVGAVLKWEGIVIDPIGALLAVLVYEGMFHASGAGDALSDTIISVALTLVVGGGLGFASAWVLAAMLKRYWIPDFLQNPISIMLVMMAFTASNGIQEESGLAAATVMGIVLGNQRGADVRHVIEFKENLRVLLISSLFIVLGARLQLEDIRNNVPLGPVIGFLVVLIVVIRPLAVAASTIKSGLSFRERVFVAWMAPRGIVAAAVASVFAIKLESSGVSGGEKLVPLTFAVIIGTVVTYGISAGFVANRLGIADQNPQGLLIAGAQPWARSLAKVISRHGIRTVLIDSNRQNVYHARLDGIDTHFGNILADQGMDSIELVGIGRLLALTPNEEVNALACKRFERLFGRA